MTAKFNIDDYKHKEMTKKNAKYNSSLLYYKITLDEINELQKELKKYERTIKKLGKKE